MKEKQDNLGCLKNKMSPESFKFQYRQYLIGH